MAKLSYLNLVNKVLQRITEDVITDVSTATGKSLIVAGLFNEAQNVLYTEPVNWYSMYATATITTVASTAEYALEADHGRTLTIINETSNIVMKEEFIKRMDKLDPDRSSSSNPTHFTIQATNYRLYPIPSGVETLRVRYYKTPTTLSANANTSDLPIECENIMITWVMMEIFEYMKDFDAADRKRISYKDGLKKAKIANDKILDRLDKFNPDNQGSVFGIAPPRFPSNYPRMW